CLKLFVAPDTHLRLGMPHLTTSQATVPLSPHLAAPCFITSLYLKPLSLSLFIPPLSPVFGWEGASAPPMRTHALFPSIAPRRDQQNHSLYYKMAFHFTCLATPGLSTFTADTAHHIGIPLR
ncbi:hypothetical protein OTU49_003909, partial [Cherax quadricarinatus]